MIRRDKGKVVIACDSCGLLRTDARWRPYPAAWADAEAVGWKVKPTEGGKYFTHQCQECADSGAKIVIAEGRPII